MNQELQDNKSPDRVKYYKPGTPDWWAEYEMLLPDGKSCYDCVFFERCSSLYSAAEIDTSCEFHPSKFLYKNGNVKF